MTQLGKILAKSLDLGQMKEQTEGAVQLDARDMNHGDHGNGDKEPA